MAPRKHWFWLGWTVVVLGCGGSDTDNQRAVCNPGDTRECVGPGACPGGQECLKDGSGYGECDCGDGEEWEESSSWGGYFQSGWGGAETAGDENGGAGRGELGSGGTDQGGEGQAGRVIGQGGHLVEVGGVEVTPFGGFSNRGGASGASVGQGGLGLGGLGNGGFVFEAGGAPIGQGGANVGQGGGIVGQGGGIPVAGMGTAGADTCATDVVPAVPTPLNLVVALDVSSSMGCDPDETSPAHCTAQWRLDNWTVRWVPVTNALRGFFGGFVGQPQGAGIGVTLILFPRGNNAAEACAYNYQNPTVARTFLDHPEALLAALDEKPPQGGTPTLPALYGAHRLAERQLLEDPFSRAAVILVTDGQPFVCADGSVGGPVDADTPCQEVPEHNFLECQPEGTDFLNTVDDVSAVASAAARRAENPVSTYVVGVGTETGTLSSVASAGGTDLIYLQDGTEPTETESVIEESLSELAEAKSGCDVKLPVPTSGQPLQTGMVNLRLVDTGTYTVTPLYQTSSCTEAGWQYDDEVSPTHITLCPSSCESWRQSPSQRLEFVLGCETIGVY